MSPTVFKLLIVALLVVQVLPVMMFALPLDGTAVVVASVLVIVLLGILALYADRVRGASIAAPPHSAQGLQPLSPFQPLPPPAKLLSRARRPEPNTRAECWSCGVQCVWVVVKIYENFLNGIIQFLFRRILNLHRMQVPSVTALPPIPSRACGVLTCTRVPSGAGAVRRGGRPEARVWARE